MTTIKNKDNVIKFVSAAILDTQQNQLLNDYLSKLLIKVKNDRFTITESAKFRHDVSQILAQTNFKAPKSLLDLLAYFSKHTSWWNAAR